LHFKRCTPFPATWLLHYVSGMGWNASTYVVDNLKKCPKQPKQNRVGRNLKLQDREYVLRNPADQCTICFRSLETGQRKKSNQPSLQSSSKLVKICFKNKANISENLKQAFQEFVALQVRRLCKKSSQASQWNELLKSSNSAIMDADLKRRRIPTIASSHAQVWF
jgi:hypothetical protein